MKVLLASDLMKHDIPAPEARKAIIALANLGYGRVVVIVEEASPLEDGAVGLVFHGSV